MKQTLFCLLFLSFVNLFYYVPNTTASPIINGLPDDRYVFKFHVSIHKKIGPGNKYECNCGGSIISERYILTAAHCFLTVTNNRIQDIFYPYGRTKIIAGTNHKYGPGIERDIIRVFVPSIGSDERPDFVDLAVAELSADLGVQQHPDRLAIRPLEALDPRSNAGVNQQAIFCGFGLDRLVPHRNGHSVAASSGSTINKFMSVTILGRDECSKFEKLICVNNVSNRVFRTACYGDSGSPLVYGSKIVGVLSRGPSNCNSLEPAKFTRLYGHMRFIEEAQNPHGNHGNMIVLDVNPKSALKGHRNPKPPSIHDGSSSNSA